MKTALSEEQDRCVEVVRQMGLTRQFDAKQAVQVVKLMDTLSPFDKVCFHFAASMFPKHKGGVCERTLHTRTVSVSVWRGSL